MHASWNGAPLAVSGGSAKSLGLVRADSESTATVTRQHDGEAGDEDNDAENADELATVLKGAKKIVLPATEPEAVPASSDDDDLNETARANDSDSVETPVGLKKVAPPSAPVEPAASKPESGQTRVAPIALPTATAAKAPIPANTPPHAWTPSTLPPPPQPMTAGPLPAFAMKVLALPPHKLALIASMTLMVAALTFVFVRSRGTDASTAPAPTTEEALFPPPVEVPPTPTMAPLPTTVVLAPPAPIPTQAQPHTTVAKAPSPPPVHRNVPRATSRTSIPTHREQ